MPSFKYKVFDVGDALFSLYEKSLEHGTSVKSIMDIGYSTKTKFRAVQVGTYSDASELVLSHFHQDHYNGLTLLDDGALNINALIIPALPYEHWFSDGIKHLLAIQMFYLSEFIGYYETDLIKLIRRKNSRDFVVHRKSEGQTFMASDTEFFVLWPNQEYLTNRRSVDIAMEKIKKVLKSNEMFKSFIDESLSSVIFNPDVTEVSKVTEEKKKFDIVLSEEDRAAIKNANDRLIRAANDICLAFTGCDRKLLSLGDLSKPVLNIIFDEWFNESEIYCVVRSAHHGTHFPSNDNNSNISTCVVVHANGINMTNYYKVEHQIWSDFQHHTFCKGTFDSTEYLRDCTLAKILDKK